MHRSVAALFVALLVSRPAGATPDDTSGQACPVAVLPEQEQIVVATSYDFAGDLDAVEVWDVRRGRRVRTLARGMAEHSSPVKQQEWLREQLGPNVRLEPPRPARLSPGGHRLVRVKVRPIKGERRGSLATVEVVERGRVRTLWRKRVARGCSPEQGTPAAVDVQSYWLDDRSVVIAGSYVRECTNFVDVDPLLVVRALPPAPARPLGRRWVLDALGEESERLMKERSWVARADLVAGEIVGLEPKSARAHARWIRARASGAWLEEGEVRSTVELIVTLEPEEAYDALGVMEADARLRERAPDFSAGYARVVEADGVWNRTRWTAECRGNLACALRIDGRRVGFVPMRGRWTCTQAQGRVACVFTHATHLHMQQIWRLDLRRKTARMQWAAGWPEIVEGAPRRVDRAWWVDVERDGVRFERRLSPPRPRRR